MAETVLSHKPQYVATAPAASISSGGRLDRPAADGPVISRQLDQSIAKATSLSAQDTWDGLTLVMLFQTSSLHSVAAVFAMKVDNASSDFPGPRPQVLRHERVRQVCRQ